MKAAAGLAWKSGTFMCGGMMPPTDDVTRTTFGDRKGDSTRHKVAACDKLALDNVCTAESYTIGIRVLPSENFRALDPPLCDQQ